MKLGEIWHNLDRKFDLFMIAFYLAAMWYGFLFSLNPKSLDDLKIANGIIMDVGSDDGREYMQIFTDERKFIKVFLNGDTDNLTSFYKNKILLNAAIAEANFKRSGADEWQGVNIKPSISLIAYEWLEGKRVKAWYQSRPFQGHGTAYQVLFLDYKASIDPQQREYLIKFRYDKYATMDDKFTAMVFGALTLIFLAIAASKIYRARQLS
ncbi:hypothetical protein [Campylobacter gracilis]|uniref:Uncharacterized protein n=1 Tax=Campylobacter gracilis RM3268 TaxID=553220 RepID=C8PIW8_9BACT|nr:hypothetical protein [Campylobacter gracilis]AKT92425.1 putative membrane protein [Campylobacter gracilis]EEV16873.1 hypothetical protein CAMGR0001_1167 [Campylobacter gracilis RM3268]UEB45394.1 hypothetical protein LK410_10470 [Campylobacter gracilis]SUW81941.1 Uncharacterised protein [Campylobacter gracilis]